MPEQANADMLILARESRGWTQREVADKISVSVSNLSRMEGGKMGISNEVVEEVAKLTDYPVSFFFQPGSIAPDTLSYRRRQVVAAKIITPIAATVNVMRNQIQHLQHALKIDLPALPVLPVSDSRTPQDVAAKLRKLWAVQEPVVADMTALMEEHGVIIAAFDFNTARVDSRSILTEDKHPIVFYNKSLLGDRQRFTLAYELGHLVMHAFSPIDETRDVSHEANLFAAALLMPEKEVKKDFEGGITVAKLADLKKKWKVSMIALLYRADDLGYVTASQKKYLLQQFNNMKIRRREPVELDVPVEQPKRVRQWIKNYMRKKGTGIADTASVLSLHPKEFVKLYEVETSN